MAYNPYVPPYGYSQYTPSVPQMIPQAAQPQSYSDKSAIQNGFISVRTVEDARNYPVAPGNSITFKIENSPYLCTKTMGFSQLDQPRFEMFRLIREEDAAGREVITEEYALKTDLNSIEERLSEVEKAIKPAPKKKPVKAEDNGNDAE